jgi:hypothetical protein
MSHLSNDNVTQCFYMYMGVYGVTLSFERCDIMYFLIYYIFIVLYNSYMLPVMTFNTVFCIC